MKNLFEKELGFLKLHIEDSLSIDDIEEIRVLKMFNYSKLEALKKRTLYSLLFISNDLIAYKTSYVVFYSIKLKSSRAIYLIGLSIKYLENGTKAEQRIYFDKITRLNYWLIQSKYNITKTRLLD